MQILHISETSEFFSFLKLNTLGVGMYMFSSSTETLEIHTVSEQNQPSLIMH